MIGTDGGAVTQRRQTETPSIDAVTTTARNWPLRSFLELGALPGAAPCARLHTRHLLGEWHQAALTASAELVVTELVTNAVKASQSLDCSRGKAGSGYAGPVHSGASR